jgi:hypothetical protein
VRKKREKKPEKVPFPLEAKNTSERVKKIPRAPGRLFQMRLRNHGLRKKKKRTGGGSSAKPEI